MAFTVGVAFTVIVNVLGVPLHPFMEGVTVIVPDIGEVPAFFAVKAAILPVPPAPRFIEVLLFVQV
jgi:hypothetical protein